MLTSLSIENFGPFEKFSLDFTDDNINIINNKSGKTLLLKLIYACRKSIENNMRGDNFKTLVDLLSEKLRWTFQIETLDELVHKPFLGNAICTISSCENTLTFSIGKSSKKKIKLVEGNNWKEPESNSIFIPSGNIFTWQNIIFQTREYDNLFGFDDTYLDLAKALSYPESKQKDNHEICSNIQKMIDGKMEFDAKYNKWFFHQNNICIPASMTSTRIQQFSAIDILLQNGCLSQGSILFMEKMEICPFFESLADKGIQIFLSNQSNESPSKKMKL